MITAVPRLSVRDAMVLEAQSWINTPYNVGQMVKGAGVDCARFLFAVGKAAGAVTADAPLPEWYAPQMATHSAEEKLIDNLKWYGCEEIEERHLQPGDVVVFKTGRAYGHAALVIQWPEKIIHCLPPHGVHYGHANEGRLAEFSRRFFSLPGGES